MKVLAIAALLFSQVSASDICAEGSLCEGHEETSLVQVKQTLKSRNQHLSNQSLGEFPLDDVMEAIEHCFVKRGVEKPKGKECCKQKGFDGIILDECRGEKKKTDWGACGGFPEKEKTKMYMHSGTAVNYLNCRKGLNDVDLWIPTMTSLLKKDNKVGLAKAFDTKSKAVKWEKTPGLTDKDVDEHGDQTYCPEETIKGKKFKEVDAFVGTKNKKGVAERDENGVHVYPKFDMDKFNGIASGGVENAKLVKSGGDFDLYVIGTCDLIALKVALVNGGRDEIKETDVEDLECLCKEHAKAGEACIRGCKWFEHYKKEKF